MDVKIVCHVKVSATGRSLVQKSPIKCGVYECYFETSKMRRSKPTGTVKPWKKNPTDVFSMLYQQRIPLWASTLLFSTEHHTSYKDVLNMLNMARCIVFFERLKTEMFNKICYETVRSHTVTKKIKLDTIHNTQPCELSGRSSLTETSTV
jgi:hypothetical protein